MMIMPVANADVYLRGAGEIEPGWDMPNDPAKQKHPTWKEPPWSPPDVLEPDHLLTKAQLLERFQHEDAHIAESTLNYWQSIGLVPRPVRRWHEGKPAALFPEWAVNLLTFVKALRSAGLSTKEVAQRTQEVNWPETTTLTPWTGSSFSKHLEKADDTAGRAYRLAYHAAEREARAAIKALARAQERYLGVRVLHARVQLFDERGLRTDRWFVFPRKEGELMPREEWRAIHGDRPAE